MEAPSRSIKPNHAASEVIKRYMVKHDCSFNKAANEIITKYEEAMNKGKQLQLKLKQEQEQLEQVQAGQTQKTQEQINAIHAWVVEQKGRETLESLYQQKD